MTYGALWMQANDVTRSLRSFGVGRTDRVAVVLPDGPEAAAFLDLARKVAAALETTSKPAPRIIIE